MRCFVFMPGFIFVRGVIDVCFVLRPHARAGGSPVTAGQCKVENGGHVDGGPSYRQREGMGAATKGGKSGTCIHYEVPVFTVAIFLFFPPLTTQARYI